MSGMPYFVEKGPMLSVVESYLNDDLSRRIKTLEGFRNGGPLGESLASTTLDMPPGYPHATYGERSKHFNEHWLGKSTRSIIPPVGGPPFEIPTLEKLFPNGLGFWRHWHGDAEGIVRQTFIRALEAALGVDHEAAVPDPPARNWPIEILWKCSVPWFESWVTWREHEAGQGQVTVLLATPGITVGDGIMESPIPPSNVGKHEGYELNPTSCGHARGMWVITHEKQATTWKPGVTVTESMEGQWHHPFRRWLGKGPVVVVAPSEPDGGVLPNGRAYVAPSS